MLLINTGPYFLFTLINNKKSLGVATAADRPKWAANESFAYGNGSWQRRLARIHVSTAYYVLILASQSSCQEGIMRIMIYYIL